MLFSLVALCTQWASWLSSLAFCPGPRGSAHISNSLEKYDLVKRHRPLALAIGTFQSYLMICLSYSFNWQWKEKASQFHGYWLEFKSTQSFFLFWTLEGKYLDGSYFHGSLYTHLGQDNKTKGGNTGPFICLPVDLSGHKSRAVAVDGFVLRIFRPSDGRSTR